MSAETLKIGQKIEMTKYTGRLQNKTGGEKTLVSQLLDIKNETSLYIAMPMDAGKLYLLENKDKYNLFFYSPNGLYHCVANVENRYRSNQIYLAEMSMITEIEKFQRRQYFRMNCILDMTCRKAGSDAKQEPGLIVDISGGGIRFNCKRQFMAGDEIEVEFYLPIGGVPSRFCVLSRVISSVYLSNRKESSYENRVEFLNLAENKREEIVKYIFEEERRRRRHENQ